MKLPSATEMALLEILSEHAELAGREVAKQFKATHGRTISYGTLYTTLRRLKEQQWVRTRDDEDQDGRIRFFSLDPRGRGALNEARRLKAADAPWVWKPGVL